MRSKRHRMLNSYDASDLNVIGHKQWVTSNEGEVMSISVQNHWLQADEWLERKQPARKSDIKGESEKDLNK